MQRCSTSAAPVDLTTGQVGPGQATADARTDETREPLFFFARTARREHLFLFLRLSAHFSSLFPQSFATHSTDRSTLVNDMGCWASNPVLDEAEKTSHFIDEEIKRSRKEIKLSHSSSLSYFRVHATLEDHARGICTGSSAHRRLNIIPSCFPTCPSFSLTSLLLLHSRQQYGQDASTRSG